MATISNTPRPGYVWDSTDNVWYPIGVGGHSHPDYITQATAISPTTVDAKGDLLVGSAADTISRLAVGADGSSIVADSSTATGLRYQGDYAAGKNKILNSNFNIWQRGTSFTTADVYTADRWIMSLSGATATTSRQTFTAGQTDVPNNPTYFLRYAVSTGDNNCRIAYRGEDAATLANTTTTVSFWAKGTNPAGGSLSLLFLQYFVTPGTTVETTVGSITLTSSWQRFTYTFTPPSVSGKTLTAGDYFAFDFRQPNGDTGTAAWTLDIANVQWEQGSVATAFQTATGTIQGELAACYRYFQKFGGTQVNESFPYTGFSYSTTQGEGPLTHKCTMRTTPSLAFSTLKISDVATYNLAVTNLTLTSSGSGPDASYLVFTVASGTSSGKINYMRTDASTAGYIYLSAEL